MRGSVTQPLLEKGGSGIRNTFFEYRTKKSTYLRDKMFFYTLFVTNKAKLILIGTCCASVATQFMVKV